MTTQLESLLATRAKLAAEIRRVEGIGATAADQCRGLAGEVVESETAAKRAGALNARIAAVPLRVGQLQDELVALDGRSPPKSIKSLNRHCARSPRSKMQGSPSSATRCGRFFGDSYFVQDPHVASPPPGDHTYAYHLAFAPLATEANLRTRWTVQKRDSGILFEPNKLLLSG